MHERGFHDRGIAESADACKTTTPHLSLPISFLVTRSKCCFVLVGSSCARCIFFVGYNPSRLQNLDGAPGSELLPLDCLTPDARAALCRVHPFSTMGSSWQHLAVLLITNLLFLLGVRAAPSDESITAGAQSAGRTADADGDSRLVVNTWTGDFSSATARAWDVLRSKDGGILDAVEQVRPLVVFSSWCCM